MLEKVWVVTEKEEFIDQLCAAGCALGNKVEALLIGPKSWADKAFPSGADTVYSLGEVSADRMLEDYFDTLLALVNEKKPNAILFWSNKRGHLLAARMAAACGTSVLTDTMSLHVDEGALLNTKMVYGGAALRTEKSTALTKVALVGAGVFEPVSAGGERMGEILEPEFVEPQCKAKCVKVDEKKVEQVNLVASKRVIGIGRGLANQSDLSMIEELAIAIQAELGCSRPIAEGEKWMATERYIGVSGAKIKPDVYIALGISGQVQHMSGVNQAKTIVAINKDKNAPVFKQADYGLVGDIYTVIPSLIEKLK